MKIKEITAFPIRINLASPVIREEGNERPPVIDFGDYFVDEQAFTSIYSKHHETTVIKIQTDNGIVGWGEAQSPVSPRTTKVIVD